MTDRAGEAGNTMSVLHNQTLDPRLRRLVHTMHDPSRMRRDLDQAVVSATTELHADEVVLPSVLTTRVLVRVRPPEPLTAIPDARWIKLIEGIYSVEVPVTELERLAALPQVDFVEAARLLSPMLDTSLPETHANHVHHPPGGGAGLTGTGVVVGIVDFDLDFTLDDFIDVVARGNRRRATRRGRSP